MRDAKSMGTKVNFNEPVFVEVNAMTESVFASGSFEVQHPDLHQDCWELTTNRDQVGKPDIMEYNVYRLNGVHTNSAVQISDGTFIHIRC